MTRPKQGAGMRLPLVKIDDDTVSRVNALIEKNGVKPTRVLLSVSPTLYDEIRSRGFMKQDTLDRIKKKLTELGA